MILLHVPNRSWRLRARRRSLDSPHENQPSGGTKSRAQRRQIARYETLQPSARTHPKRSRDRPADVYTAGGDVLMGTARKKMKEARLKSVWMRPSYIRASLTWILYVLRRRLLARLMGRVMKLCLSVA